MKKLIGIAAIASLLGMPALAADMAVKMPLKAPPAPAVYGWTGCYIGANIGGAWQHNHTVDITSVPQVDTGTDNASGVVGGGQIGCDYQFANSWVVGIQDMLDATSLKGSHLYPGTATELLTTQTRWIDTLTARLGYLVTPQALLYLKGGGAWARIHYTDTDPAAAPPYVGNANVTRSGWTLGGGGEYAFMRNWSAFAEFDYIDLGNRNVALTYTCAAVGAICPFANPFTYRTSHNISELLVGINYRFR